MKEKIFWQKHPKKAAVSFVWTSLFLVGTFWRIFSWLTSWKHSYRDPILSGWHLHMWLGGGNSFLGKHSHFTGVHSALNVLWKCVDQVQSKYRSNCSPRLNCVRLFFSCPSSSIPTLLTDILTYYTAWLTVMRFRAFQTKPIWPTYPTYLNTWPTRPLPPHPHTHLSYPPTWFTHVTHPPIQHPKTNG